MYFKAQDKCSGFRTGGTAAGAVGTHLAFNEDVKEVLVQVAGGAEELSQRGLSQRGLSAPVQPQARQLAGAGALIVQPAALRAGQQLQELIRVWGHHRRGQGCRTHRTGHS